MTAGGRGRWPYPHLAVRDTVARFTHYRCGKCQESRGMQEHNSKPYLCLLHTRQTLTAVSYTILAPCKLCTNVLWAVPGAVIHGHITWVFFFSAVAFFSGMLPPSPFCPLHIGHLLQCVCKMPWCFRSQKTS